MRLTSNYIGPIMKRVWLNKVNFSPFSRKPRRTTKSMKFGEKKCLSILFVGHDANLAGAQLVLLNLMKWIWESTNFQIKMLLLDGGPLLNEYQRICPVLSWTELSKRYPDPRKKERFLRKFVGRPDLVYGNTVIASNIYDTLKYLNAPYLTHVHELQKSITLYAGDETVEKMCLLTNKYIACSNSVASNLKKKHGILPGKIDTIHPFVQNLNVADPGLPKKHRRKRLGLLESGFIVLGCGSIYWRKGVDLFIDTAFEFSRKEKTENFHFYWIGENVWNSDASSKDICSWEQLEEKICSFGLENNISFIGRRNNVLEYLLAGDVFYLPSREDPFPLVCLEAAQCGLPIIYFSDAGSIGDFVGEDAGYAIRNGDTMEASEKIASLAKNKKLANYMGQTAREKFNMNYTISAIAPKIIECCIKAVEFQNKS